MEVTFRQQLEAAANQSAAQQLQQAHELQALQQGVGGRMEAQEGAISALGVELQNVRERAEMQATEPGRFEAVVQEGWCRVEDRISTKMGDRMERFGEQFAERDAHFSEAN